MIYTTNVRSIGLTATLLGRRCTAFLSLQLYEDSFIIESNSSNASECYTYDLDMGEFITRNTDEESGLKIMKPRHHANGTEASSPRIVEGQRREGDLL
jgi:hypothetical protein